MGLFTAQNAEAHRATILDANGEVLQDTPRGAVHPDDSLALVAYYHSMNGDCWIDNSGWLVDNIDFWVGVHTVANVGTEEEPEWRVTRLNKLSDNMPCPGVLPQEMRQMTHLQRYEYSDGALTGGLEHFEGLEFLSHIFIRSNLLVGELPWEILGDLPRLQELRPYNIPQRSNKNRIVGSLPAFPDGSFPRLQRLDVFGMLLEGEIPVEIANWPDLQRIRLAENLFTGEVPDLSGMSALTHLMLFDNDFTPGPIWEWLKDMGDHLRELEIWNTNRTGTVPEWIATDMHELRNLGVGEGVWRGEPGEHPRFAGENALGGEIPDLTQMADLRLLRIYGRNFTGPIPAWIALMPSLERLWIHGTGFEGPIPDNLPELHNMDRIYITNNPNLTGGLPAGLAVATAIDRLQIFDNPGMEVGQLPDYIGELTTLREINFSNIGITGTIPQNWIDLTALGILKLRDNPGLTGPVPDWVPDRDFTRLSFSNTGMDIPEIPSWLQNQDRLIRLGLSHLGMEGELPDWMGDFLVLSHLSLNDNNLSGSLDALGSLQLVDSVMLGNNNFSGELSETFMQMGVITEEYSGLQKLDISGNPGLTGPIPLSITQHHAMQTFRYEGTGLCEPEDSEFHEWLARVEEAPWMKFPPFQKELARNNEACPPTSVDLPGIAYRFHLHNNYPNPFNPSTTISYEIPAEGHVELRVYNILGQHVATLVNEVRSAGRHQVNFDAGRLASGTYVYRLEAGNRTMTQSMMLLK